MRIGFTGTQQGMTEAQINWVRRTLAEKSIYREKEFHHGDCVGADAEAHEIAYRQGYVIWVHPPVNESKRAMCQDHDGLGQVHWLESKPYLERNHDIVEAVEYVIATPATMREKLRSGTWATVRFARKLKKAITVVYPDGTWRNLSVAP